MAQQLRKAKTYMIIDYKNVDPKSEVKCLIKNNKSQKNKVIQLNDFKKQSASAQAKSALMEQAKQLGW
ncbi:MULTISPECIES: hypothetical protein [Vibrio harveyi group]|uniref:hypothetical protein n=1 Tax=Vibrio harveyi group TaxID=717610 RepID=UPI0007A04E41|nr:MULTISPECIES: hypothetical protein [Vibrio harveyi group]ELA7931557.1 hypothetical protein [Vibrio parahaemolyticus]KYY12270.1 hypothetical protein AWQ10_07725 [Vibrio parahaemolyticus]MCS0448771.1 hypothetical protein [Vibrio diabolicus]HCG8704619.1 hypothetical protein [Vibrio parahaemolyticus]